MAFQIGKSLFIGWSLGGERRDREPTYSKLWRLSWTLCFANNLKFDKRYVRRSRTTLTVYELQRFPVVSSIYPPTYSSIFILSMYSKVKIYIYNHIYIYIFIFIPTGSIKTVGQSEILLSFSLRSVRPPLVELLATNRETWNGSSQPPLVHVARTIIFVCKLTSC